MDTIAKQLSEGVDAVEQSSDSEVACSLDDAGPSQDFGRWFRHQCCCSTFLLEDSGRDVFLECRHSKCLLCNDVHT